LTGFAFESAAIFSFGKRRRAQLGSSLSLFSMVFHFPRLLGHVCMVVLAGGLRTESRKDRAKLSLTFLDFLPFEARMHTALLLSAKECGRPTQRGNRRD
jgi:hypothetical protein